MDPGISPSFIPKKPLVGERRGGVYGFLVLIAILLFVASGVAAGGVFVYGRVLSGTLETKKEQLETSQKAYDPEVIEELVRLDARINEGRVLLEKHIAPSVIFSFLEENTLADVQFVSFSYVRGESNTVKIEMDGVAKDFSTVALQSDRFGASKLFREIVFSNIAIGVGGGVTFTVSAVVSTSDILFSKQLSQTVPAPVESIEPDEATNATSTSGSEFEESTTTPAL